MPHHRGPRLPDYISLETLPKFLSEKETSLANPFASVNNENESDRRARLQTLCVELLDAACVPETHFRDLDYIISRLMPDAFDQHPARPDATRDRSESPINERQANDAKEILHRLPRWPQRLLSFPLKLDVSETRQTSAWKQMVQGKWPLEYLVNHARGKLDREFPTPPAQMSELARAHALEEVWDCFYVTSLIDCNSLVFISTLASHKSPNWDVAYALHQHCDVIAELIDVYEESLQSAKEDTEDQPDGEQFPISKAASKNRECGEAIVRAFLWSQWQRMLLLLFYSAIGGQLAYNFSGQWAKLCSVRGLRRLDYLNLDQTRRSCTDYLCNYSLQQLRRSRSASCLDLRYLIKKFHSQFEERTGVCVPGTDRTCEGDSSRSCHRFEAVETKAQSAHSPPCRDDGGKKHCRKIHWDRESYLSTKKPWAVSVCDSIDSLKYCQADKHTLAISHVWSHGHGGNPEDGLNECLHHSYSKLATAARCDSYWIDSAVIPRDPELRDDAILEINAAFERSRAVLIVDRDIMTVDLHNKNIDALETLLTVLLVCDWSGRAWTMLEASRGNESIYLLCKGGFMYPLHELFRRLYKYGAIDLIALLVCCEYLLPLADPAEPKKLEHGGNLLSQRHASRAKDDGIIWALLRRVKPSTPAELWKTQDEVRTGYIFSSAPRVIHGGKFWAPATPLVTSVARKVTINSYTQHFRVRYASFDGGGSYVAQILEHGLIGKWLVREMDLDAVAESRKANVRTMLYPSDDDPGRTAEYQKFNVISGDSQEGYMDPDLALACDEVERLLESGNRVRLLRPLSEDGKTAYFGGWNRREHRGPTAAICFAKEGEEGWMWRNVHHWVEADDGPQWSIEDMLLL